MTLRILREPAAQDPLFLEKHLMDAPEAAKGEATDDDGQDIVLDKQGKRTECEAGHQPDPPTLLPPPIFHLDDQGVTDADAQEYGRADDNATDIHSSLFRLQISAKPTRLL